MVSGGSLIVCTKLTDSHVIIDVKDKGTGMSKKQLERLGKPYYSTKGSSGTGLSMMVSFGIIRAMKGTISVNSELGKGTQFHISIPRNINSKKSENFKKIVELIT